MPRPLFALKSENTTVENVRTSAHQDKTPNFIKKSNNISNDIDYNRFRSGKGSFYNFTPR